MESRAFIATGIFTFVMCLDVMAAHEVTTDRNSFYAVHPNLVIEDFEAAEVNSSSKQAFDGPLDSFTSNSVVSPGDIHDGVKLRTVERFTFSTFESSQFVALGSGYAGMSSKGVAVNDTRLQTDKIAIIFEQPQYAVGMDLSSVDLFSNTFEIASLGMNIYSDPSSEDSLLGGAGISVESPGGVFLGITSDRPIGLILLSSATAFASPVLDNVAFTAPIPEPPVATLSCILAVGLGLLVRQSR